MPETPVNLSSGLPETVLPAPPGEAATRLQRALDAEGGGPERVAEVAADFPRFLDAWAALGALSEDRVARYAYFRVGYHRGLDLLRSAGWRGNGYVRWRDPTNRGFLRCLDGLRQAAADIGEDDEAERCDQFLHQLDPEWDRRDEAT